MDWRQTEAIVARAYTCGYCGKIAGPNRGYATDSSQDRIYLCTYCGKPTYFDSKLGIAQQVPGVAYGNDVDHLPTEIESLYREARNCMAVSSYTGAVLLCRKLLMNIAVSEGAKEGKTFISYVEHLAAQGYVPPKARGWIDHIRVKGNEANHEIQLMSRKDAEELIMFLEMLLKLVFEFPSRVPPPPPTS